MAGFNPYGGTRGPEFKLPDWLTGNYGKPNYYDVYKKSRNRGGAKPAAPLGGRPAAAGTMPTGAAVVVPAAPAFASVPAGTVTPGAIVTGLTPDGTVDRSQGDEYRSQLAQYGSLIGQKKTQEAEDLGMKIYNQKYAGSPMLQAGGAVGAYNPLLASMFPDTKGYAGTFAPQEEYQMGDLGTRAQGEMGPTMESLNPVAAQAQQQAATAAQADKATTAGVKIPVRNRVQAFLYGGM